MVDYKVLLKKYINHVGECEGVTFIPRHDKDMVRHVNDDFTTGELEALLFLEKEIEAENVRRSNS